MPMVIHKGHVTFTANIKASLLLHDKYHAEASAKQFKLESNLKITDMNDFGELIPGLPEEIALECLTRLHYSAHQAAAGVCRRWRELLQSRDFYLHRKQTGVTNKAVCFVQALPVRPGTEGSKSVGVPSYGVSMFDPVNGNWDWLAPVPNYPNGIPLFSQLISSEGKLVAMGGWDPVSYAPVRDVFVYDFTTKQWKQGAEIPDTRSFFAAGDFGGRIIVAGGHDESKNALSSALAYDVRRNEWMEMPRMNQDRDECEAMVMGSEFWAVSGYKTENQGRFESSADAYSLVTGQWRRVENVWKRNQCPRGCIGVRKQDGKLMSWADGAAGMFVRMGTCVVDVNGRTFVCGSAYQGESQGFYFVNEKAGNLERIGVPDGFLGPMQSGCRVEI